jgi:hypothetical protein
MNFIFVALKTKYMLGTEELPKNWKPVDILLLCLGSTGARGTADTSFICK